MTRPQLLKLLGFIQNDPANQSRDIMTFAGFCPGAELVEYVWGHFVALSDEGKARAVEVARTVRS